MKNAGIILWAIVCLSCVRAPQNVPDIGAAAALDSVVERPELTLVFSGDVMQHLPQVEAERQEVTVSRDMHRKCVAGDPA